MASLTIRGIDDSLKQKLRIRAALHSCSMEEEVRVILQNALMAPPTNTGDNLAQRIHQRFATLGGVELALPERELPRASDNDNTP